MKVTNSNQSSTRNWAPKTQLSYVPACVINKWIDESQKWDHINILTGIKKKVSFIPNPTSGKRVLNSKVLNLDRFNAYNRSYITTILEPNEFIWQNGNNGELEELCRVS